MMRTALLALLVPLVVGAQYRPSRVGRTGASTRPGQLSAPAVTFHGKLKEITGKAVVLIAEDEQEVTLFRNRKTRFLQDGKEIKPNDIPHGAGLTVDVTKAPDAALIAVNVVVEPAPPTPKQ